jgi:hypothetical protein
MDSIITTWKDYLKQLIAFYEAKRGNVFTFYLFLFLCFVLINISCYWLAMFTAFPELTHGNAGVYYFKIQFPVGFLGALFDSLSFFVTIFIIRHALRTEKSLQYVGHLSLTNDTPQILVERNAKYEGLLLDAVARPADNMRNIYFGLIMGVSAMIPTCVHIYMFLHSCVFIIFRQKVTIGEN